ncbi:hypothetical protein BT67DRAFT_228254 [Trichocladium antarcticum]|uniref:Uncharacterized protein n=1 Tax=Trichocladium antarcticum TaxID=1450529 RepID=A0AAN6UC22_9PEZI|nr:hypothetical protein BT67DRAFT_228254 [Trichocladium antarcticum]
MFRSVSLARPFEPAQRVMLNSTTKRTKGGCPSCHHAKPLPRIRTQNPNGPPQLDRPGEAPGLRSQCIFQPPYSQATRTGTKNTRHGPRREMAHIKQQHRRVNRCIQRRPVVESLHAGDGCALHPRPVCLAAPTSNRAGPTWSRIPTNGGPSTQSAGGMGCWPRMQVCSEAAWTSSGSSSISMGDDRVLSPATVHRSGNRDRRVVGRGARRSGHLFRAVVCCALSASKRMPTRITSSVRSPSVPAPPARPSAGPAPPLRRRPPHLMWLHLRAMMSLLLTGPWKPRWDLPSMPGLGRGWRPARRGLGSAGPSRTRRRCVQCRTMRRRASRGRQQHCWPWTAVARNRAL